MKKKTKKSKMTIDKLASMTHNEFCVVHEEIREIKEEMHGMKEEIIKDISQTVIDSNDKLATKIDSFLKDSAAHDSLHQRTTNQLLDHESRLRKVETKLVK